jgi:hypothetical protein
MNHLNAELNPICHLLVLLRAHLILHVSRIRVKHVTSVAVDDSYVHPQASNIIHDSTLFVTVFLQWTNNTNRTSQAHKDADALCCERCLVYVFYDTVTSHPRPVSILASCTACGSARI